MATAKLKDRNKHVLKVGDEVYWNDPAMHDLETKEERKEAWLTIWKVDEIDEENEMVCISTEHSEAQVYPRELVKIDFYPISGINTLRYPDDFENSYIGRL